MISKLEANGVVWLPTAMVADIQDLDERIKYGDESGWRGDPSMGIFLNRQAERFEVWGIDRSGRQYMAASHDRLDDGWIILKLLAGDPYRHDVFQETLDHNAKVRADNKAKDAEAFREVGDKLHWALRKDLGLGDRLHAVGAPDKKD